jgi:hypothetical protein
MAQRYDVSLKTLFQKPGDGIVRRLLFGGKVVELLPTEQPLVQNNRVDMVGRKEDGSLQQVEFQSKNEGDFALRMLEYYPFLVRTHGRHVGQTVLYMGREPLRMGDAFVSPSTVHRFMIVNLRELDAEPLLESDDWADNALALLAKGSPERALEAVIPRLRAMGRADQDWATGTLVLLSGILGIEEQVNRRLEEVGMIDVMENKVLGPLMQKRWEEGQREGRQQGREQGRKQVLVDQLNQKFGELPEWASKMLGSASAEDVDRWLRRILKSATLEETLG